MPRQAKISYEEVAALLEASPNATLAEIRAALGDKGSFSTISRLASRWHETRTIPQSAAAGLIGDLKATIRDLTASVEAMDAAVTGDKQELLTEVASLKIERDTLVQESEERENTVDSLEATIASRETTIEELRRQIAALELVNRDNGEKIQKLGNELAEASVELRNAPKKIETLETEIARLKKFEIEVAVLRDRLDFSKEKK